MSDTAHIDRGSPQVMTPRSGGLPCRAPGIRCRLAFWPTADTVEEIQRAARVRNDHEQRVHDYAHAAIETARPDFTKARRIVGHRAQL